MRGGGERKCCASVDCDRNRSSSLLLSVRWRKIIRGNKIIFACLRYSILLRNRYRTSSPPDDWFSLPPRVSFSSMPTAVNDIIIITQSSTVYSCLCDWSLSLRLSARFNKQHLCIKYLYCLLKFFLYKISLLFLIFYSSCYNIMIVFVWMCFIACCVSVDYITNTIVACLFRKIFKVPRGKKHLLTIK